LDKKSQDTRRALEVSRQRATNAKVEDLLRDETQKLGVIDREKARTKEWYLSRKMYIKGILLTLVILLVVYAALRLVKYIVANDYLNKVMVRQALGATNVERATRRDLSLEGQQMQQVQGQIMEQMAAQQAAAAAQQGAPPGGPPQ
jgi:hypothetical protein